MSGKEEIWKLKFKINMLTYFFASPKESPSTNNSPSRSCTRSVSVVNSTRKESWGGSTHPISNADNQQDVTNWYCDTMGMYTTGAPSSCHAWSRHPDRAHNLLARMDHHNKHHKRNNCSLTKHRLPGMWDLIPDGCWMPQLRLVQSSLWRLPCHANRNG